VSGVASANEGKIRQAHQNRVISGRLGGEVRFTVAGKPSDVVFVKTRRKTFAAMTIRSLKSSFLSGGSYRGSGGDTVVRVRIRNAQPEFNGGSVQIFRGSTRIDSDPVRLH
ncbi:MAG: hypothetical protein AAGJ83_03265, partial [Planctomycetota bacterium]